MFDVIGKYNKAIVYANSVDAESYAQVLRMCNLPELGDSQICMMPDMHASEGCTVGTSMTVGGRVNPAFVGGDIGCGMQVYALEDEKVDLPNLDRAIRSLIPAGAAIFDHALPTLARVPWKKLHCVEHIRKETVMRSFGTLGGGNHFVELDRDTAGRLYLVIHSGSRRLGRDVALYHQIEAFFDTLGISPEEVAKKKLRPSSVQSRLHPSECFLSGERLSRYFDDMKIAVAYARESRRVMGERLIEALGLHVAEEFATVHNYIDTEARILRKGAVSAAEGEILLIPINMKDGSLLCRGRGNPAWNCTAPHGAGRVLKRSDAKASLSMEEYRMEMEGIYSTSVNESTLDESPMAYRRIEEILDAIEPTAEVVEILTPLYNFKASKPVLDEEVMDGED